MSIDTAALIRHLQRALNEVRTAEVASELLDDFRLANTMDDDIHKSLKLARASIIDALALLANNRT